MPRSSRRLFAAGAALALLPWLSACRGGAAVPPATGPAAATASSLSGGTSAAAPVGADAAVSSGQPLAGNGPGISVDDALRSGLDGPLLVNGYVLATGDSVTLCEQLSASRPPQCAAASLPVRGFDLKSLPGAQHSGDLTWSETPAQLLGEVQNGMLVVSPTSQG